MALKCGIVGLPNVGKSTLFNCLSNAKAQAANFPFCTIEPNVGVITVPDERLNKLSELVKPQAILPTTVEIVDIAGLVKGAKKKLDLFKAGRIKLETAMMADTENTEYHFLRLSIEEHSPKIVKYHSDIEKDKAIVQKNFKNLSPVVQKAILDYCKNSKVLHTEDF